MIVQATTNKMLSFLDPAKPQPWASFIEQIDRVEPHLGELGYWLETLKHPKRVLNVDIPIRRDDGTLAHFEKTAADSSTCRAWKLSVRMISGWCPATT